MQIFWSPNSAAPVRPQISQTAESSMRFCVFVTGFEEEDENEGEEFGVSGMVQPRAGLLLMQAGAVVFEFAVAVDHLFGDPATVEQREDEERDAGDVLDAQ